MHFAQRFVLALSLIFLVQGCQPEEGAKQEQVELETIDQKAFYGMGVAMAKMTEQQFAAFEPTVEERELVIAGFRESYIDQMPRVDLEEINEELEAWAQTRIEGAQLAKMTPEEREQAVAEKEAAAKLVEDAVAAGQSYLDEAAAIEGAVVTESGLIYVETQAGEGESPAAENMVKVHYEGKMQDGTVFDSSLERGEPAVFPLNRVIPCWTEGVQMMKVGGKARLVCPSDIAYGDAGAPPKIPGGAVLSFEVELIEIMEAPPQPEMPGQ
jgi:FKBP-type peptidyl-prolyl cis-trans isomerase FkpA